MDIDKYIESIRACKPLPERDMRLVCNQIKEILAEESSIQPVNSAVNVCSDVHGQFYDVLTLPRGRGYPDKKIHLYR